MNAVDLMQWACRPEWQCKICMPGITITASLMVHQQFAAHGRAAASIAELGYVVLVVSVVLGSAKGREAAMPACR